MPEKSKPPAKRVVIFFVSVIRNMLKLRYKKVIYVIDDNYLFKDWILEEAKKIEQEISKVEFEKEYGLTQEKMQDIKQRIYRKILEQISEREELDHK